MNVSLLAFMFIEWHNCIDTMYGYNVYGQVIKRCRWLYTICMQTAHNNVYTFAMLVILVTFLPAYAVYASTNVYMHMQATIVVSFLTGLFFLPPLQHEDMQFHSLVDFGWHPNTAFWLMSFLAYD